MGRKPKSSRKILNNIRRLRFENGEMTQKALAEASGVSRQTIISIEAARYAPSLELAFQIAEAFGVPIQDVFSYPPKETPPSEDASFEDGVPASPHIEDD